MPYPSPQVPTAPGPFFTTDVGDPTALAGDLSHIQHNDGTQHPDGPSVGPSAMSADGAQQFVTQRPGMDDSLHQGAAPDRLTLSIDGLQPHQHQEGHLQHQVHLSPTDPRVTRAGRPKNTKACDECRRKKVRGPCDLPHHCVS